MDEQRRARGIERVMGLAIETLKCALLLPTSTPMKQVHDGRNGTKNWRPCRFRYFRITNTQDRVDAIIIYGGEKIRKLIETLPNVPTPSIAEPNEYEMIIAKLNNNFTPMINKDSARRKLDNMWICSKTKVSQLFSIMFIKKASSKMPVRRHRWCSTK